MFGQSYYMFGLRSYAYDIHSRMCYQSMVPDYGIIFWSVCHRHYCFNRSVEYRLQFSLLLKIVRNTSVTSRKVFLQCFRYCVENVLSVENISI